MKKINNNVTSSVRVPDEPAAPKQQQQQPEHQPISLYEGPINVGDVINSVMAMEKRLRRVEDIRQPIVGSAAGAGGGSTDDSDDDASSGGWRRSGTVVGANSEDSESNEILLRVIMRKLQRMDERIVRMEAVAKSYPISADASGAAAGGPSGKASVPVKVLGQSTKRTGTVQIVGQVGNPVSKSGVKASVKAGMKPAAIPPPRPPTPLPYSMLALDAATIPLPFPIMAMPKKLIELPTFSGRTDEWPFFISAFRLTTLKYGYDDTDNAIRLQMCLTGRARDEVCNMISLSIDVPGAIETLELLFGRPNMIIKNVIAKAKQIPKMRGDYLEEWAPFAAKIRNLAAAVEGTAYNSNQMLLDELVLKLLYPNDRLRWSERAATIKPHPTIKHFSEWTIMMARQAVLVIKEPRISCTINLERESTTGFGMGGPIGVGVVVQESEIL